MARTVRRGAGVGLLAAAFALGWLGGSATQQTAQAQVGDLGKEMMKKAGDSGGPLGTAAKLGVSIKEMQEHVNGLQQNIDTLNQIKAGLGG